HREGGTMAELTRVDAGADPGAIGDVLAEDGAVLVEDLLEASVVEAINAEIDDDMERADPGMAHINPLIAAFFGDRTKHLSSLVAISPTFATEVLVHPLYLALCDRFLGPACARFQLNLAQVINRGGGSEAQIFHRDEDVWIHMPAERPTLELASMIALVDFTRENGATMVVPGSHRWEDRSRQPEPDEVAHAEMAAGSAVVYLGSTVHAGGANESADTWRRGGHLSYCLGWLRTEENNYLGTPPEVAARYPRAVQEVLGYAVHDAIEDAGGYLGVVGMRDPVELMAEGSLG
ncbi:MAG: phytanoyl-CoA dioxygenase family protein, partial [Actinomycetota bacterium]